jgi:Ca-activated chloride channel family protein
MRMRVRNNVTTKLAIVLALLLSNAPAATQHRGDSTTSKPDSQSVGAGQVRVPNRAPAPLFNGKQGKQKTEISFDPATRMVTLKLLVQDPSGYFIPNIRRDNFVVYENGVRQQNVSAEVEHAPVSVAVLLEFGGCARGFNRYVGEEVTRAAGKFLDELGREDKIAIWKYSDKVEKLADLSQAHESLPSLLLGLETPEVSETNLYDATVFVTEQMRTVTGRKAIILISSGIDTFSKTPYQDVLQTVRAAGTPIYGIGLTRSLRQMAEAEFRTGPVAKVDWTRAERELQEIAAASGGRAYLPESTIDLTATYDDLMENLKVRYVITYRSSNDLDPNSPRSVRVALVNPQTGGPLQIVDANGKRISAYVIVQGSYIPAQASGQ